ncbi:MAG: flagellar protein FlgN [Firmicutes bacterium]|nr:flagellar protein FlgN [Bacillota bacterium]
MIEGLWQRMAEFLAQEAEAYADLAVLGKKKQEALVKGSLSDLEKVTRAEQVIIARAGKIEEKRWKLQEEVASFVSKPVAEVRFADIIPMAEEPYRESLEKNREAIQSSIRQITELNEMNSELIQQSLAYVNFMLSVLSTRVSATYDTSGEMAQKPAGIVDRKA